MENAKILAKVDKILKQIDPNSKKQIMQLSEDANFRKNIDEIKKYIEGYDKNDNFPSDLFNKIEDLTSFCNAQYKELTEKKVILEKQQQANKSMAKILNEVYLFAITREDFSEYEKTLKDNGLAEYIDKLRFISQTNRQSAEYTEAEKVVKSKITNLETNTHIEIDLDRISDKEKILSYISIEFDNVLAKVKPLINESFDKEHINVVIEVPVEKIEPKLIEGYVPDTAYYEPYMQDAYVKVKNVFLSKIKAKIKSWFGVEKVQALGTGIVETEVH